LLLDLRKIKN